MCKLALLLASLASGSIVSGSLILIRQLSVVVRLAAQSVSPMRTTMFSLDAKGTLVHIIGLDHCRYLVRKVPTH